MGAPDEWLYEYALVRYVPCPERGEFLNIGLVMMCKRRKWLRGMVMLDEERILAFCPKAELNQLRLQSSLFERKDVPLPDLPVEEKYRWLTAVKSASLQISPSHPAILNIDAFPSNLSWENLLNLEFDRLFTLLVL